MSPSRDGDGHSVKRALGQGYPAREKEERCFRNNTAPALEQQVVQLRKATGYGRARLSRLLWQREQLALPNTIRRILGRHGLVQPRRRRKVGDPAHWAWETQQPFALAQVDVQDIRDEATLGPRLGHYLTQAHLPRYQ